jgi:hypothetical protein
MNIYTEFKLDRLRVKTQEEEIEIKIQKDFYSPIPGTESFEMFRDEGINKILKDFIDRHRNSLGSFAKINYWFFRNRVLVLVDKECRKEQPLDSSMPTAQSIWMEELCPSSKNLIHSAVTDLRILNQFEIRQLTGKEK